MNFIRPIPIIPPTPREIFFPPWRIRALFKANYALSHANAFAVAAAVRENAQVLTGDPEYEAVEQFVKVEWLGKD